MLTRSPGRSALTAIAVPLLVLAAVVAVGALRREANARRADQLAFANIEIKAQDLNGHVLEAAADRRLRPEITREVQNAARALDAAVRRELAGSHSAGMREIKLDLDVYGTLSTNVLDALRRGDHQEVGALDEAIDRAFTDQRAHMHGVERQRARAASRAETRGNVLSLTVVLVALILFFALNRSRRRAEVARRERAALEHSEARFRALIDDNSDLILVVGPDGAIRDASRACADVLGFAAEEVVGRALADLVHPDDFALLAAAPAAEQAVLEWRMRHRNGYWLNVEALANDMTDDPRVGELVLTVRDVTERKALEEQLRHRAFHDPLTQLPNRALFHDRLQHALNREGRYEEQVAILFVDLDDFKVVNDTLGHSAGDELLVAAAGRLRGCLRSSDTAARLGGDEFGVLLEGIPDADQAVALAERILQAFSGPFQVGTTPVPLQSSIGIAVGAGHATAADELQRNADLAMYSAKNQGKGRYVLFHADEHADLTRRFPSSEREPDRITWFMRSEEQRLEILRLLNGDQAIVPAFQPIIDLRTAEVHGFEALARFPQDPDRRPPNVWFAQAHRCGLGIELELRAVEAALNAPDRPEGVQLGINVSPTVLRSEELLALLGPDLRGVIIEITEHELASDPRSLKLSLDALRRRGAQIAVDDAGAGYAGLRQLMLLGPDSIKLDRGLIEDIARDDAKQALVECFVRFAERTGASVCAEGIETVEDLGVLADLGVTYGQGYVIARPGPAWPPPAPEALAAIRRRPVDLRRAS